MQHKVVINDDNTRQIHDKTNAAVFSAVTGSKATRSLDAYRDDLGAECIRDDIMAEMTESDVSDCDNLTDDESDAGSASNGLYNIFNRSALSPLDLQDDDWEGPTCDNVNLPFLPSHSSPSSTPLPPSRTEWMENNCGADDEGSDWNFFVAIDDVDRTEESVECVMRVSAESSTVEAVQVQIRVDEVEKRGNFPLLLFSCAAVFVILVSSAPYVSIASSPSIWRKEFKEIPVLTVQILE